MKRFVVFLLAFAIMAGMGSIAYAAEPEGEGSVDFNSNPEGSASVGITGTYRPATESDVYSVKVSWPEMKFHYTVVEPKWIPVAHQYVGKRKFSPDGDISLCVKVSNRSNRAVKVTAQLEETEKIKGLDFKLLDASMTLPNAALDRAEHSDDFVVTLTANDEEPDLAKSKEITLGKLVITISADTT